jgi:hypothetical protein
MGYSLAVEERRLDKTSLDCISEFDGVEVSRKPFRVKLALDDAGGVVCLAMGVNRYIDLSNTDLERTVGT